MLALKIFIIIFLLLCVIGAGVIAAIFFGVFGDDFEITKEELKIGASNSKIVDKDGNVIADLSGDEKRKVITLNEMASYLPKAYVAIEDERFYSHNGVDFKRTGGAIINTVFGKSSYGGSTITQQLVKNITKDDESSGLEGIMRKVKEWAKAYQVERMISKDQILELYLNLILVGGRNYGVQTGAEYYFNTDASNLSIAQCAFLAGINNSPNKYNPYKNPEPYPSPPPNPFLASTGNGLILNFCPSQVYAVDPFIPCLITTILALYPCHKLALSSSVMPSLISFSVRSNSSLDPMMISASFATIE